VSIANEQDPLALVHISASAFLPGGQQPADATRLAPGRKLGV